ncbi:MAG: hypothetical protein WAN35_12535 [Terracidiphilus sp.]
MIGWNRQAAFCIGFGVSLLMTACGGGGGSTTPPPQTTYTLTVSSTNPASAVAITVSPADTNGSASGSTSFTRVYDAGTSVTLTAPATSGGNNFTSWTGCASASTVTCTVMMSANTTVTANYAVPVTYTLTVNSTNPTSGVTIGASPADNNNTTSGSTGFTLTYNSGTAVTLTAPATSGGSTFSYWSGCTSVSGTAGTICSVTLNANTTVTANYITLYTLTVNSTNPASGVIINYTNLQIGVITSGTTSFTVTETGGTTQNLTAPPTVGSNTFSSWTGCTSVSGTGGTICSVTMNANTTVTANYTVPVTYTLTVNSTNPASGVAIGVSPADNNSASSGNTSFTRTYDSGTAVTLTAPSPSGSNTFSSWTGCTTSSTETCNVTLNANTTVTANFTAPVITTPTVVVTPGSLSILTTDPLSVTVTLIAGNGDPTPTGSVVLTGGGYTSATTALSGGSAQISIPANSLTAGADALKATYTPDTASSSIYNTASGTSSTVTVTAPTTITVSTPSTPIAVTDQILGMNMAVWDDTTLAEAVTPFETAGIKAVRWPGGSTSDFYHWEGTNNTPLNPSMCATGSYAFPNNTFANFVNDLAIPAGLDIALTADYGTNPACTGGGLPSEAAAWVTYAQSLGVTVSHMTVGNEEFGGWEMDMHVSPPQDTSTVNNKPGPSTTAPIYAAAVGLSTGNGFYAQIKAASPSTQVGVDIDPNYAPWDQDVLSGSSYDFIEYHYYATNPGYENDTTLVKSAAQTLTTNIKKIRTEMTNWGTNKTAPIYVGEIGSVSSNPGKQSWSITQGLYAGQALGEMMNDGVVRSTWWIGFGNCNGTAGNDSASFYGWQDWGAYNVFSDGSADSSCSGAGPLGTMSPTAQAFHLFSNVAVNNESVLTASVAGDTADVVAYAATHSGGTALMLFNRNETTSEPVEITISGQSTASSVTVETYDKSIYDQTNATIPVWAEPTTTTITSPTLPLILTLTPWSMNVVIIQ